jgi:DNA-binding NarL/FixJ family response regulator
MKPHGSRGCFGLTPRQTDLLELMMQGHSNKLIARELGLSVETVKDHVAAIFRVLKVSSRTQAVVVASRIAGSGVPRAEEVAGDARDVRLPADLDGGVNGP